MPQNCPLLKPALDDQVLRLQQLRPPVILGAVAQHPDPFRIAISPKPGSSRSASSLSCDSLISLRNYSSPQATRIITAPTGTPHPRNFANTRQTHNMSALSRPLSLLKPGRSALQHGLQASCAVAMINPTSANSRTNRVVSAPGTLQMLIAGRKRFMGSYRLTGAVTTWEDACK